ncbi:hypothetical protein CAEBREN_12042 [Caenorhabditis brenneri]|uniref:Uncharacterized protein n=1 Tax=Caenorhabditis brenneri TaxID=135651 RepID=G0NDZ3_CAEBE|nr:hypothetical protein CAEBREN_12042 [Caenorhabditis brenneri]
MPRRDNANTNAQYLEQLQEEFKDFEKEEKDLFIEKGKNYQEARNALIKMRSKSIVFGENEKNLLKNDFHLIDQNFIWLPALACTQNPENQEDVIGFAISNCPVKYLYSFGTLLSDQQQRILQLVSQSTLFTTNASHSSTTFSQE